MRRPKAEFDVAVVGAGLAGLQCARLIARRGLEVLLIDRKPSPDAAIQTTGIFVRRTLEDFKFPEDCLGPPVRRVTLYSPARRALELCSQHDEFQVGRMEQIYRFYLEECLRAGVAWRPHTTFLASEPAQAGSKIRFQTGGQVSDARVRYIVGADGTLSRVARDLSLGTNNEWLVGVEDVYRTGLKEGSPCFHCFLDPVLAPGYVAWVVDGVGEVHVGLAGYPHRFEPLRALEKFKSSLGNLVTFQQLEFMERRGGRIPVGGVLQNIANGRGLLVGDAAGAPSPLTAGGLDPCLRLSAHAANAISEFLRTSNVSTFARYDGRQFRARFISRLWMRRALASMAHPGLMELACWVLRWPLLRTIAWKVFFGRGSFPDLEAVTLPA